jgi:hypothetical protein
MPSLTALPKPPLPRDREALAKPLLQRMLDALTQLVQEAPLTVLQQASAAPTGAGSAASLLSHLPEASPMLAAVDPEAAAIARAAEVKRSLLGFIPMYSTQEVAVILGFTAEAVRKRRLAGKLLAVPYAEDWRFPVWQFASAPADARDTLRGLERVLAAMPMQNPWARLELLTAPIDRDDSKSIVDLLKAGAVDEAVEIVAHYGEQGA